MYILIIVKLGSHAKLLHMMHIMHLGLWLDTWIDTQMVLLWPEASVLWKW